jgi:hypothetical protein
LISECAYRAADADSQLSYQAAFNGSHIQRQLSIRVNAENLRRTRLDPRFSNLTPEQLLGRQGEVISHKRRKVKIMPLLHLVEVLIVVGVLLWLVNRFIPMQGSIKSILNGVVVIAVVLWLLNIFGLFHSLSGVHIGKG